MVSRSERSSTPSKRLAPRNYRFEADVFPAVLAVAELLHAGDRVRFAEDALVEAVYDLGLLNVAKAPLMPRATTLTSPLEVSNAIADVEALMNAMGGRLAARLGATFLLRAATFHHAVRVLETFPKQKKFAWPAAPLRREVEREDPRGVKAALHPRLEMAVDQWVNDLAKETARPGRTFALQRAVRMKLTNLGVDPLEHFQKPKLVFRQPQFVRMPHPQASFETRAMEERFLAIIQALETIAAAAPEVVVPPSFKSTADRLIQVAEAVGREE
ncbi:MAG: hypothetical protein Q8O67_32680 [Deltaproteobacteria bacterium]|nr:hypothetical protein [Deltaproteobacteria bacterium]